MAVKPFALMCCGCRGVLAESGKLIPFDKCVGNGFLDTRQLATFSGKEEADAHAVKLGWSVEDKDGPNHRCPDCKKKAKSEPEPKRRGAYLRIECK